jgi:hypothetical protein
VSLSERFKRAMIETLVALGTAFAVWSLRPSGAPWLYWFVPVAATVFVAQATTRQMLAPAATRISLPTDGRHFATCTPLHPMAYHKTMRHATDALRPKRTRRWAQRVWPEGTLYEWNGRQWVVLYRADQRFTRGGG